ncbi:putative NBD/HSP70 family sugar kinase [Microbacterium natoriense]|uniref:NBD/HSP70 family sugar kinase n=2 Tax=Microbacterium natoriense TaxID=284570 RepID=A0AAW8EVZ0_9MICO|nr:putative NBD/HSP70 family sugar kinase [Microbacterium natoriense]
MTEMLSTPYSEGMPSPSSPAPGTRPHNLARILRLVHEEGAQSRAALTETTGLNRSTIADLVGELIRLGLVDERIPETPGRVGRPSPVVAASSDVVAIAVNPEVDAVEIAAIGLDRSIRLRKRVLNEALPTPQGLTTLLAETLQEWCDGPLRQARITAIGIAVPGLVRASDGVVRNAPHLEWRDVPLADLVADGCGIATVVDNDASLGAIAEHRYGAGHGIDDIVYLNGGASGIGGGLIIRGVPVAGAGGYAGEFGQNRPRITDDADRRTADGVLEAEVSRRLLLDVVGLEAADDDVLAAELSTSGSPDAAAEVSRQGRVLAGALANAVNVLNPAVIVLGGFLATLGELRREEIMDAVTELAMAESAEGLGIRSAALGADRLLIGAAELAFAGLIANPAERG